MRYALAYLVCFQIMVNHVHIAHSQQLIDSVINIYIQKEQLTLLDEKGHPSLFALDNDSHAFDLCAIGT